MRDQGGGPGRALWTDGDMTLRIEGTDRVVRVERPFALVGQGPGCDIRLAGPSVNRRHVYLHLDPRGVYAVDLVSRSGIRINGERLRMDHATCTGAS